MGRHRFGPVSALFPPHSVSQLSGSIRTCQDMHRTVPGHSGGPSKDACCLKEQSHTAGNSTRRRSALDRTVKVFAHIL